MNLSDKIKLFNGVGSWRTYTANGEIPQIFMSDGPHGLRKQDFEDYADLNRSNVATCFPTGSCIASSWDKEALQKLGEAIAKEALAENVQLVLGPGINIKRSPLCGRNFEYYSEDPYLAGTLAANYIKGMQSAGVGTCVKHFACNNQEKRRQTSSSNIDEKTLHKIYLRPFEIAVKQAEPVSVMCSYNKVNGTYVSHNAYLLNEVLRKKWGFNGAVISDWGACIDAVKCVKAGLDLAMPDSYGYFEKQLKNGLENKSLLESDLDTANSRVISLANKLTSMRNQAIKDNPPTVDFSAQYQTAVQLASDSAVLLKNDGFFPLQPSEIVIVGELAQNMKFQGGGSSHITTAKRPDAIQTFQDAGFEVTYVPGYFSGFCKRSKAQKKNAPLIKNAVKQVQLAVEKNPEVPVLFFCGLTDAFEGEGFDRTDMKLPQEQLELLEQLLQITKNIGVISFSGAPVDLSLAMKSRSILHMYLAGEGCSQAIADLVSGKTNPSGKLAETWPLCIEDTPCYGNFASETNEVDYVEGELVGYRWYSAKKIPVQFPFGFGLSYTTFKVEKGDGSFFHENVKKGTDLFSQKYEKGDGPLFSQKHEKGDGPLFSQKYEKRDGPLTIPLQLTNTGSRPGAEVLQLYTALPGNPRVLCGFEKVFLQPAETRTVNIELDDYAFCDYDLEKHSFVFKEGEYEFSTNVSWETGGVTGDSPVRKGGEQQSASQGKAFPFTTTNSLSEMSTSSFRIRVLLNALKLGLKIMHKGRSLEDPSIKIEIAAIYENPLESLISTSGGIITEKLANRIVCWANGGRR